MILERSQPVVRGDPDTDIGQRGWKFDLISIPGNMNVAMILQIIMQTPCNGDPIVTTYLDPLHEIVLLDLER